MRNKNIYGDNITVNNDFCRKLMIFWYQLIQRNISLQLLDFILLNVENTTSSPYPIFKLRMKIVEFEKGEEAVNA